MMTFADAELPRHLGCMQWSGTAIGHEREIPGIEAALGGHAFDRIGHCRNRDAQKAGGCGGRIHSQRGGHALSNRCFGSGVIEAHLAPEETVRAEPTEDQIGVGYGRKRTTQSVTGRTWFRAGALRAYTQRTRTIDSGDRPTARAHLEDIHHRDLNGQSFFVATQQRTSRRQGVAFVNDAGLCRRSAHVERNRVLDTKRATQCLGSDHTGGRSGFQHAHAGRLRLRRLVEASRGLHDEK